MRYQASQISPVLQVPQDCGALLRYNIMQFILRVVIHITFYLQEAFCTLIELSLICCIFFHAPCLLFAFVKSHKDGYHLFKSSWKSGRNSNSELHSEDMHY